MEQAKYLFQEMWGWDFSHGEPVPPRWNLQGPNGNFYPISHAVADDVQTLLRQIAEDHPGWI